MTDIAKKPIVAILMGSQSDAEYMYKAHDILIKLEVPFSAHIISAHRLPDMCAQFAQDAAKTGYEVIIAGAGAAAALPGTLAAHTQIPILGVPLATTSLLGLDAMFAITQMPAQVPVACMGIGPAGAHNSALMAARILALKYSNIRSRLENHIKFIQAKARENSKKNPFESQNK